jgi:hypothetical protein
MGVFNSVAIPFGGMDEASNYGVRP